MDFSIRSDTANYVDEYPQCKERVTTFSADYFRDNAQSILIYLDNIFWFYRVV